MSLFDIPTKQKSNTKSILNRVNKSTSAPPPIMMKSSGAVKKGNVLARLNVITNAVEVNLGKYKDKYGIIRDINELHDYIDECIKNDVVAIDTETSGLDPMLDNIAGASIYTPTRLASYIPLNHLNTITMTRVDNQISVEDFKNELMRLVEHNTKIIMFNAKFDIRVIKNQVGVKLKCYWDGFIAAKLLNENETSNRLKHLHNKYCLDGKGDAFTFDDLFEDFNFQYIPIKTGYIYASRDAEITYELYKFQEPYLTSGTEECIECDLEGPSNVFWNIEMPFIDTLVDLEDTGVFFDFHKADELREKYHKELEVREKKFLELCDNYDNEIQNYRRIHGVDCKLDTPIAVSSPQQLSILFYDILKVTPPDPSSPRGTGESILVNMHHPLADAVINYRETAKLLDAFVDKLPNMVNPHDGRIHAHFNAMGAATGRLSSSGPNLQQIPSRGPGKITRSMFVASKGCILVGSDFSAQEPRVCAHMCQDKRMIEAYQQDKDLYCFIASIAFDTTYEDCLEFHADGTPYAEGKARRSKAKAIVLGIMYGKGIAAIADDLHVTKQKASEIYEKVMTSFPRLREFVDECKRMAYQLGYVDTIWGRKRRLPNIQLPPYEFKAIASTNFDPLALDDEVEESIDPKLIKYYTNKLDRAWGSQKQSIKEEARRDGLEIKDNGGYIAEAERQCVNARIQGSSADICKIAMNLIHNDEQMKQWGFKLLLPVHDELIGEVPYEYAKVAGKRLSELMVASANGLDVPMKCDVVWSKAWYENEVNEEELDSLIKKLQEQEDYNV